MRRVDEEAALTNASTDWRKATRQLRDLELAARRSACSPVSEWQAASASYACWIPVNVLIGVQLAEGAKQAVSELSSDTANPPPKVMEASGCGPGFLGRI